MLNPHTIFTPRTFPPQLVSAPELQALLYDHFLGAEAHADHACADVSQWRSNGMSTGKTALPDNLILSSLSAAELAHLVPHLERITLTTGQVIGQPGQALQHVYFPTSCSLSWVSHTVDGESDELALVGRDGLIGVPLVLGGAAMQHTVQVQCGGEALRMGADVFVRQMSAPSRLHKLALLYVQWQMGQMAQSIVCSRHHAVSERLSHWLLSNAQGANSQELRVTHETISHMLGVRRESITQAAGRFQAAGWIANSRGKITLKDPEGLRSMACECQARSQQESKRYLQQLAQLAQHAPLHGDAGHASEPLALTPYGLPPDTPMSLKGDLQKYVDAYDFAPVGFVTLDAQGRILQTNLAGAILLDIQRSQCQHHAFSDFLADESQAAFAHFHLEVLGGQCSRHCVVHFTATVHRSALQVRIDATVDEWGVENRMVLIDVSDPTQWAAGRDPHWPGDARPAALLNPLRRM
ncbi:helix-turn-helix domain-containing protein [Limnohabitans sp.]|jgi:CRP-like cAMP-binding protein|uniref:helix-turn-helix domain-containing protein n=1 Tax=Limnohabitans sp. TaxID=1907725 RepID=UPI0039BC9B03|nr:helix-turn-helix domain-containing protein [Comamonadaceae bacterium]